MDEFDLDALRAELEMFARPTKQESRSPLEERVIAGFEEIVRFVQSHGRWPQQTPDRDIFERLYAVRLERLRQSEQWRALLGPLDQYGLLAETDTAVEALSDEALLAALGSDFVVNDSMLKLSHVRSRQEIRAAEEVAQRTPCADFELFAPHFDEVQQALADGLRQTVKYQDNAEIKVGDLFILDGQKVLVAAMGEQFMADYGRMDRRLRVIYDNGTESDLLMRSLQRALNKDKLSRRITHTDFGPLFASGGKKVAEPTAVYMGDSLDEGDLLSGTIYVLRSNNSFVAQNRQVVHKIGVTGGDVQHRIANAKKDPTYLMAEVEVVATYQLVNINRKRLEALLQKFFSGVRLDITLMDRFGQMVKPQEWFVVPLAAIEEAVERVREGTLDQYRYDAESARLVRI